MNNAKYLTSYINILQRRISNSTCKAVVSMKSLSRTLDHPAHRANDPHPTAVGKKRFFITPFRATGEASYATSHLPEDYNRATETPNALADPVYRLSPYSDGGGRQLFRPKTSVHTAIPAQRDRPKQ
jgi:hypothetical protein